MTISPDGTRIVYVGPNRQLYVRAVDQLEAVALRGGVGINPFISPDWELGWISPPRRQRQEGVHPWRAARCTQ